MPRADLQNIRDECFFFLCSPLCSSALIYLEVHEEILNEITSCLWCFWCWLAVVFLLAAFYFILSFFFCLPNLKVYSAEIWIHKTAISGGLMWSMTNWKTNTFFPPLGVVRSGYALRTGMDGWWRRKKKTTSSSILKIHKTQRESKNKKQVHHYAFPKKINIINRKDVARNHHFYSLLYAFF